MKISAGSLGSPLGSVLSNASTPRVGSPLNAAGVVVGVDAEENGGCAEPGLCVFEPISSIKSILQVVVL